MVPASAGLFHPKAGACSFGKDGTSGSSFGNFNGRSLAFQQATRRLYATQSGTPSFIYGFDASSICPVAGYPLLPGFDPLAVPKLNFAETAIVADNTALPSAGNVYVLDRERIEGYDDAAKPLSGFPVPKSAIGSDTWKSVAVDPEGHLWAGTFQRSVYELSATGEILDQIDLNPIFAGGFIKALAFDATGNLFVAGSQAESGTWKLAAPDHDPNAASLVAPGLAETITVDRGSGDLYLARAKAIERYDAAGKLVEKFPAAPPSGNFLGIAVDEASKAVYAFDSEGGEDKVDVFEALTLPDVATSALGDLTETSATLNGTVDPDGVALSACKLEYVTEAAFLATGFTDLSSGGEAPCSPAFGSIDKDGGPQAVSAAISGLSAATPYRFRLSAANENGSNATPAAPFTLAQPSVETVGSPIRSATTARLDARVDPHGLATDYHFEYLTEAAYEANLAASQPSFAGATETPEQPAGAGGTVALASAPVSGLAPATAYRYRVLADNGAFGGAVAGAARSLTTRASDEPLSHGGFPGPTGSDRAWELVSIPDSSGNPVRGGAGIAADGESALYSVNGGTRISASGTLFSYLYSHRPTGEHPSEGWQNKQVYPSREEAAFSAWQSPAADDGLSTITALNFDPSADLGVAPWRIPVTGGAPTKLFEVGPGAFASPYIFSDDGSRAILSLQGKGLDPAHPNPTGVAQLYDVSSGTPQMVLQPGGVEGSCATKSGQGFFNLPPNTVSRPPHWLSPDGSRLYFPSCSGTHLSMHDFGADATTRIDGPQVSGPDCTGALIRSTPGSAYLWTQSRLSADDVAVASCATKPTDLVTALGGDVYRYDLATPGFECLTCIAGLAAANVEIRTGTEGAFRSIAVAPGGQRLYFSTRSHLLAGAPDPGTPQIYRLDAQAHQLAYVGPLNSGDHVSSATLSSDGRFLAFSSAAPGLDALTGSSNGKSAQAYLYDDLERSLVCASCPADGSAPRGAVGVSTAASTSPNMTALAEDGTLAFSTPTALVGADQNTAATGEDPSGGEDVYEWRDGRALLVSDGLADWPKATAAPKVATISPSGRDLFFVEAAQLTPDARDGYARLYDARIGGGMDFPPTQGPCPLEVCQGTPKGVPEKLAPGSGSFAGAGNEPKPKPKPCARGKRRIEGRCVAKKPHKHRRANKHHKRGAGR